MCQALSLSLTYPSVFSGVSENDFNNLPHINVVRCGEQAVLLGWRLREFLRWRTLVLNLGYSQKNWNELVPWFMRVKGDRACEIFKIHGTYWPPSQEGYILCPALSPTSHVYRTVALYL